ncbi:MAG: class I SAM-dependent methyltransferase family protein [Nanoarchaeota archaeon]|nr:class I SAM-dependent methyltransferase family protein [Nanoarchaeota archaeon]MBU4352040.1 class I SAM-dependent methyltransferase family protein [Nanoarchaeota archaeon]MBU4456523.1 class I SAM-dependent methyltransferase family protein [Nanoarchaeota archaeon]MCG2719301.1 class I SAM-dependent methyltransferase family protein [Nanoarchaeota archaeon]
MKAVKVKKKDAQEVIRELKKNNAFNGQYEILKEKNYLYIPVSKDLKGFEVIDKKLKKLERIERSLVEALKNKLSAKELKLVPRSFDIIGDIAIIEIDEALVKKEKLIGEALLRLNKNLKVIAKKVGFHSGEFRTQKLKVIAGEKRKITLYKENDIRLKLNVETCYFSPRLSTERMRVAKLIKKGEKILVMFSGVAPYPLVFAKNSEASEIFGVELNPDCHKFALENIKLNKVKNVTVVNGDAREEVPKLGYFDRILMPLPKSAEEFLDVVLKASSKGTIVHFYDFLNEENFPSESIAKVKKVFPKAKILDSVKCGQSAPGRFRVCIDFQVF